MSKINDDEIKGVDPSIDNSSRSLPGIDFGSFVSIAVTSSDKQLNSDQVTDDNKTSSSNPQPLINSDNFPSSTNSLSLQKETSSAQDDNQDFSQIKSLASFPDLSTTSIVSDSNPVDKPDPIKLDEKDKLSPDSLSLENKTNSGLQPSVSLESASQQDSSNLQLVSSDSASQLGSLDKPIQSSDLPKQEVIQNNSQEDRKDLKDNLQNSQKNQISSAINPAVLDPKNTVRTATSDSDPFDKSVPEIEALFSDNKSSLVKEEQITNQDLIKNLDQVDQNSQQNSQSKPESKPGQEIDLILGKDLDSEKNSLKQVEESQQNQPQNQTLSQDLRVSQGQQSDQNVVINPEPQTSQGSQPNPESKIDLLQQDSPLVNSQQIIQQIQGQDQGQGQDQIQNKGQNQEQDQGQIKTDLDPLKDLPTIQDNQQNQDQNQTLETQNYLQNQDNQQTQNNLQNQDNQQNQKQIQDQNQTPETQNNLQNPDNRQTQNNQQIEAQDTDQQILNLPSSAYKQLPSNRQQITSVVDGQELDLSVLKLFELTQTSPDQLGVGESGSSIKDLEKIDVNKIQKKTINDIKRKDDDDQNKLTQKNDQNPDHSEKSSPISNAQSPSSSESDLSSKQEVLDPINSSESPKKFVDKVKNKEDESAKKIQGFFQRLFKKDNQKTTGNVNVR